MRQLRIGCLTAVVLFLVSNLAHAQGSEGLHRTTLESNYASPRTQAKVISSGGFPALQSSQSRRDGVETSSQTNDTTSLITAEGSYPDLSPKEPQANRAKVSSSLITICSSLSIVLALFAAMVWAMRRFGGTAVASKPLPISAMSPLGHIMLDQKTKLVLVKCGRRLLVLSQTATGVTPVTEITHPDEVRELIASCSAEARQAFEKTLKQIEREPAGGFTDALQPDHHASSSRNPSSRSSTPRKLFATA